MSIQFLIQKKKTVDSVVRNDLCGLGPIDIKRIVTYSSENDFVDLDAFFENRNEFKFDYTDYIRLKLVLLGKDKKVMGVSNLVAANEELDNKFQDFDTSLKVNVNNSSVNIIFNTPSMKSKGGKNKFNAFSFERAYNQEG